MSDKGTWLRDVVESASFSMFLYASIIAFACIAFLDEIVCFELGRLRYEMTLRRRAIPAQRKVAIPDGGDCIDIMSQAELRVLCVFELSSFVAVYSNLIRCFLKCVPQVVQASS